MELSELKLITASNLINLRTRAGFTQAELGAKLNYSDKNISKWERGESIPDAFVLTQLAELYEVSVDYILSSHDAWEAPEGLPVQVADVDQPKYSAEIIIAIAVLSVMTAALTAFVILWLCGIMEWRVFLVGISLSLLTFLVLDCVFYKARLLQYILSAFVVSLFVLGYFVKPGANLWQLFLLCVPAIALVFLGCNVRRKPGAFCKNKNK